MAAGDGAPSSGHDHHAAPLELHRDHSQSASSRTRTHLQPPVVVYIPGQHTSNAVDTRTPGNAIFSSKDPTDPSTVTCTTRRAAPAHPLPASDCSRLSPFPVTTRRDPRRRVRSSSPSCGVTAERTRPLACTSQSTPSARRISEPGSEGRLKLPPPRYRRPVVSASRARCVARRGV